MKKYLSILLSMLFVASFSCTLAQGNVPDSVTKITTEHVESSSARLGLVGGGFQLGIPRGDYKAKDDVIGYGLGGNLALNFPDFPLIIGLDISYLYLGGEDWLDSMVYNVYNGYYDVHTSYQLASSHIFFRFYAENKYTQPYLEGLVGFNFLWASTTVDYNEGEDDKETDVNFKDFVFSGGLGGGIMLPLLTVTDDDFKRVGIFLDLNLRYLFGGKAEYLKKGSLSTESGSLKYKVTSSRTDMFSLRLGVCVRF
jgi:hypothetical protein